MEDNDMLAPMRYEVGALAWCQRECDDVLCDTKRFWTMAMGSRKGTE